MNRNICRIFLVVLFFSGIALDGFAFTPKKYKDGVNEGTGNETGTNGTGGDGSEVKLPLGLPFQITDPNTSSGGAGDDNGVMIGEPAKIVYTFDLPDGQGPESVHETHSAFEQARSMNAACVLIRMSSMSGALGAAANISNEISDYDRPVMVYVNDRAIPASQLISMASENKNQGANHGKQVKHSPASKNKTGGQPRNYKRNAIDETSCTTGMSSSQFLKNQLTAEQESNLDEVLAQAGLNNYTVVHYTPGFYAQMIDLCMKPYISLLLILLLAIGMRVQLTSAFPGPATFLLMVSLPLFGVPLYVGGLAGAGEFGLVIFLVVALIITGRKKSSSKIARIICTLLLLCALTLCQSENFGPLTNWLAPVTTLLFTIVTFTAGWFIPTLLTRTRNVHTSVRLAGNQ